MNDDELTPEQKFSMQDPADRVHSDLSHGRGREEILTELLRYGWSKAAAERLILRAADDLKRFHESPESRLQLLRDAKRQMVGGCVVSSLAVAFGALSFVFAMAFSAVYLIPWGFVIVGLILAARGYARWRAIGRMDLDRGDGSVQP